MTTLAWHGSAEPRLHVVDYPTARRAMKPGDIIAFAGEGFLSRAISWVTRCPISHVGIVLHCTDGDGIRRVQLMESTTLNDTAGVQRTWLSDRVTRYAGRMWWLPISHYRRVQMNELSMVRVLEQLEGRGYDFKQVAHFYWDRLNLWAQKEDVSRLFCSELAVLGLKAAGVLPVWFDSAEFRPHDLVSLQIYANDYYQLRGTPADIGCFNCKSVEKWRN